MSIQHKRVFDKIMPLPGFFFLHMLLVKFPVNTDRAPQPLALSATNTLLPVFGSSADARCRKMHTARVLSTDGGASQTTLRA